jgi:hypothetical protein
MNIASPKSIEDHIIINLQNGALPIIKLIEIIEKIRPKTTKQGVYLAIRKLKKQEIVVVHKKNASLSSVWLKAMEEFFVSAQYKTKNVTTTGNGFLNLQDGEKLTYFFKNPILTDAFWSHVFLTCVEASSPQKPVLIYNPHEWFILARTDNEIGLFNRIAGRGQELGVLVGGTTPLDTRTSQYFDNSMKMYGIAEKPLFPKNNYYINIIGDFVIEAWLDKKISLQIEDFYKGVRVFSATEKANLEKILSQKGKNKFSVSRNKRKADMIRAKFKKYFLFKQP